MLKKNGARIQTKTYLNFNEKNEAGCRVVHEGTLGSNFGEDNIETGLSVCVTERGNYIVTEFSDLFRGETNNFATGISIEAKGDIFYNQKKLTEDFRGKIDENVYAVIKSENGDFVFYPVKIDENELYIQYSKEKNSVEFTSVSKGKITAKARNTVKAGICFADEENFIRENAEPYLFNACSIETAGY